MRNSRRAQVDLALVVWVGAIATSCGEAPQEKPPRVDGPDVVLVVIDTLRADSAKAAATPTLDGLAAGGKAVPHAWSPSTWTAPSTMSLMTGTHVREHGWDQPFPRFMSAAGKSYPSIDDRPTIAEVLSGEGYTTIGFYANPLLSRMLGWQRGFDTWEQVGDPGMARALKKHLRGLSEEAASRPLFTYLHLLGPHQPLKPSFAASGRWGVSDEVRRLTRKGIRLEHVIRSPDAYEDQYVRAYHASIEDTDRVVADLLKPLQRRGRPILIIVTSDHGELLGEHQMWGHEESVWNALTHVPLVVSGVSGTEVPDVLSTAAIPDLVTRSVGIDWSWPVTLLDPPLLVAQRDGEVALSADGELRGIWSPGRTHPGLVFDVSTDPDEESPIRAFPERAQVTMHHAHWTAQTPWKQLESVDRSLDAETRSLLEELGYMGTDAADD